MRTTIQDLLLAIDWLQANEGEDGESEACERVAAYLMKEVKARKGYAIMRTAIEEGATLDEARIVKDRLLSGAR